MTFLAGVYGGGGGVEVTEHVRSAYSTNKREEMAGGDRATDFKRDANGRQRRGENVCRDA